jgi:hypothetical protein
MNIRKSIFFATAAIMLTVSAVWYQHRPATPRQATWDDVLAEAKAGGYRIITTQELAEQYRKNPQKLLMVDTRQEWEYRTGHLPGAVNFSMEPTWWNRLTKAGDLKAFLGPDKKRFIIFY